MVRFVKILLIILTVLLLFVTIFMIIEDLKPSEQIPSDGQSIIGFGIWITMRLGLIVLNSILVLAMVVLGLIKKAKMNWIYYACLIFNILLGIINYQML